MRSVSFEYFPGRTDASANALKETVELLFEHQPVFQSVTFGAGGSDKSGTFDTLNNISKVGNVPSACHLTYSGMSRQDIHQFADKLWDAGYRRLVALRGDASEDGIDLPFENTAAFVWSLKRAHPFEIAVSCYPETHPMAESADADIEVLKAKQDAGADFAISQFFFDNNVFYAFVDKARAAGVTIPIIPGILPIYNFERVVKMAKDCGTFIPEAIHKAFNDLDTAGSSPLEVAAEILKEQVKELAYEGYEQIHIYTLNKAELASLAAETFLSAEMPGTVIEFRKAG